MKKFITIKELYEIAKSKGYENAYIGIDIESSALTDDDDYITAEYCEATCLENIAFGNYYALGKPVEKCVWLNKAHNMDIVFNGKEI